MIDRCSLSLLIVLTSISTTALAEPIFMRFAGLQGETQNEHLEDWSDIFSLDVSVFNNADPTIGPGRGDTSTLGGFSISKPLDRLDAELFKLASSGTLNKKVEIISAPTNTNNEPNGIDAIPGAFLKWTLEDVAVVSYSQSSSSFSGERPTTTINLNAARVTYQYKPRDDEGGFQDTIEAKWDFQKDKAFALAVTQTSVPEPTSTLPLILAMAIVLRACFGHRR